MDGAQARFGRRTARLLPLRPPPHQPVTDAFEERPGVSVFFKDESGTVFHTYSTYGRGIDGLNTAYSYLDLTPKGRDEAELPYPMAWVKHHDQYER